MLVLLLPVLTATAWAQQNAGTPCGIITKAQATSFWSANFEFGRTSYPSNERCNWTLQAEKENEHVVLLFADYFGLESGRGCPNDYVAIYDGADKSSPLIGRYCGIMRPPPMISTQDKLFVEFVSDSSVNGIGFLANMGTSVLAEANLNALDTCGGYITNDEGVITSPNFPNTYGNNKLCIWRVTVHPIKKLHFTIAHMDIEESHNCQRDGLVMTAVEGKDIHRIGRYCGVQEAVHNVIDTDSNDVIIVFNSDLAGSLSGFKLEYSTKTSGSVCPNTVQLTGQSETISSVVVDESYNRMLTCNWLITVQPGYVVEIGINSMNSDPDCLKDQLSIYDGSNIAGREIARICGQSISKKFVSNSNQMYLVWHLDAPMAEKQVTFTYSQKPISVRPQSALVQIRPETTKTPERVVKVTPKSRPANRTRTKIPTSTANKPQIKTSRCAPCDLSTVLDRSICDKNYVLQVKVISQKRTKSGVYYVVQLLRDWRLGPLSFHKTSQATKTKIFVTCKACPALKKRAMYLVAGMQTKTIVQRRKKLVNALLQPDDFVLQITKRNNRNNKTIQLIKSHMEDSTC